MVTCPRTGGSVVGAGDVQEDVGDRADTVENGGEGANTTPGGTRGPWEDERLCWQGLVPGLTAGRAGTSSPSPAPRWQGQDQDTDSIVRSWSSVNSHLVSVSEEEGRAGRGERVWFPDIREGEGGVAQAASSRSPRRLGSAALTGGSSPGGAGGGVTSCGSRAHGGRPRSGAGSVCPGGSGERGAASQ